MMQFDEKLLSASHTIEGFFWDKLKEETQSFPDTEEGVKAELIVTEIVFTSIIINYLMNYKKQYRAPLLEELIEYVRHLETCTREID